MSRGLAVTLETMENEAGCGCGICQAAEDVSLANPSATWLLFFPDDDSSRIPAMKLYECPAIDNDWTV
jgi:hypothetical protein